MAITLDGDVTKTANHEGAARDGTDRCSWATTSGSTPEGRNRHCSVSSAERNVMLSAVQHDATPPFGTYPVPEVREVAAPTPVGGGTRLHLDADDIGPVREHNVDFSLVSVSVVEDVAPLFPCCLS